VLPIETSFWLTFSSLLGESLGYSPFLFVSLIFGTIWLATLPFEPIYWLIVEGVACTTLNLPPDTCPLQFLSTLTPVEGSAL